MNPYLIFLCLKGIEASNRGTIYFGEGVGEYLHEINFSEDYKIWSSILIFVAEETSLKKVAPPTSGDGHTEYRCRLRLDPKGNPGEGFK